MEIHRQTCQKCDCRELKNFVVRNPGSSDKIYVQCTNCDNLVARYIIGSMGYYHHGKGFESFLRSLESSGNLTSGKDLLEDFEKISVDEVAQFKEILKQLKKDGRAE